MKTSSSVDLRDHTSIKVGGLATTFVTISSPKDLESAHAQAHQAQQTPLILGGGTNTLLPNTDLPLVWKISSTSPIFTLADQDTITVWAGNPTAALSWTLIKQGYGGLEKFTTLPGSIGGAIVGNAHAGDELISQHVIKVEYFDRADGQFHQLPASQLDFSYDHSIFHDHPNWIITQAWLYVQPHQDVNKLTQTAQDLMAKKRQTQCFSQASAGCFWQNPLNTPALQKRFPQFAHHDRFPAGFLIEQLHLDFTGCPAATGKHCSYLVNQNGATQADILACARRIQQAIWQEYHVWLTPEVIIYDHQQKRNLLTQNT